MLNRFILSLVLLLVSNNLFAAIDLTSASSAWSEVLVGGNFDPGEDQQAAASVDLTGFGAVPLFYMKYDDGGTPGAANSSDDEVAFRFRADNAEKNGDFSGYIWIGLDIDSDTDIDAFMMLIGKNGAYSLDVYDSGAGLNTSPSNTDLTSGSQTSVTTGFALSHDLITNIDTGGNADVDGDSDPDYLISYKVNFDALAAALNAQTLTGTNPAEAISTISSNAGVTIETNFKLVVSSAQNDNVLNGDIGGYNDKTDLLTETYDSKGAFSSSVTFSNLDPADLTKTTITTSPATGVIANGVALSTITVQAIDSANINLTKSAGLLELFTTGSASLSTPVTDNADGTYTATITSLVAETVTISGTLVSEALVDTATVAFIPGPVSAVKSEIIATPATVEADGSSTSAIIVQAKDTNGNNLTASAGILNLSSTGTGVIASINDELDGTYTATIKNSAVETVTITGTIDGSVIGVTDTVDFIDTTNPVVTLLGISPINLELGSTYSDAGATALDNIDGDISGSIVSTSTVNTSFVGGYTVTYNVSDAAGNAATTVVRTVNVTADATAPVITLLGSTPVNIELGSTYTDAGATALDNIDGNITGTIATTSTVNTGAVGTYSVTYNVSDAAGNAATPVVRTVNVTADVTIPVITLLGNSVENIERGIAYVDAGATALDNVDGDITGSINTVNPVDVNTVGPYTITYNVVDSSTNVAVQVTRTVNVTADVTIPVITLLGNAVENIERGTAYVDAGATALDNFDGDITPGIVTVNPVDVNTVGPYTITYNVVDSSTNAAVQVTRTVNVTADATPPVINLIGANPQTINIGDAYTELGASATDNVDNDVVLSLFITIDASLVNTAAVGSYNVTYNVSDAAGNAATPVVRTVNVTADVTVPVITLLGNAAENVERGTPYVDAGATALDNIDGDITGSIVTVNPVDVNTVGPYTVTYNVVDSSTNAAVQVTRTVNVTADVTIPVITLLGNAVENIERGTAYVDAGATALDNIDGVITGSIVTVNPVDVNTVGPYTVTYNVVDSSTNAAVEVTRTVNVTADVTIPVITRLGNAVENIERGTAYVDAGATALDNIDGVITGSIVTVNPVDVNTVGPYTVTYNVVDSSTNAAVQVTRAVNVTADVTVPVITLLGNAVENIERGTAYVDAGATALDNIDGVITGSIVTVNPVDVNTVGPYTVTYNVIDSSTNAAVEVTRTVNVTADVTIPVITLLGNAVENIERGTPYVDAGATAFDNFDGNITPSIVTVNPVDVNTVGPYTITYNVVDSSTNAAVQVTRTVNVTADVTIPVITRLGNAIENVERGTAYVDAGATALDNFDGDITLSIVTVNPVDVNTVGPYTVTYNVVDSSTNAAVQVSRTVNVTADVTIPVITRLGNAIENIERGTAYVDAGATALDNFDGDITLSIVTVNPVDVNTVGPYTVTYNVVDSSTNAAVQVSRTVNVTADVTIPVIILLGNAIENIERGTAYVDAGATALDDFDGDVTSSIVTVNPVDVNTVGPYTVTYNVVDSSTNAAVQVSRTVNVTADVTIPVITLLGNAIENIERGTAYVDVGATALDNFDGVITGSIVTVNPVDVNTVGPYTITYNVVDSSTNAAVQVTRTVNVTADVTNPVITLLGNAIENIERGTAYVDAGATAVDNIDGVITGSIVTVDPVDVNTVGPYTVTYNVVDSSTNAAVEVTRTVNVTADVTIPVITLLGNAVENIERGTAYVDAGATAVDNIDGVITGSIVTINPVDVNTVGPYIVTYNVVDSSTNAAVLVTRTVNVTADVTIPVITLLGNAIENIERGIAYVDAGATALDNFDGDITPGIVTVNPVDVNTVGPYTVTYNVVDSSTNAAVQVTRTVNVAADVTIPIITLLGNAIENIERGTPYVDAGATAVDNIDGVITGSIVTVNPVDVNTVGPYTITYNVVDSSTNAAVQVTRTVNVVADVTIPVITLLGNAVENIERGTPYVDAGATALDNIDGVITGSIVTINPVDVNTVGPYTVTYNVVDSSTNAAVEVTRTVNVTADVTIPIITLLGNAIENIERGTPYVDAGATAVDNIDGVITGSIVTVNPVDVNTVGPYTITYNVVDSSTNAAAQVTRTVNVTADVTIPVITLLGNAVENIERGSPYTDAGATALDNFDGVITGSIVTINPVDMNTVGPYTITYNVVDSSTNAAVQVTRTVNVTADVTIPVITLLGNAVESIQRGNAYVDAGATALDNFDGDITGSINTVNPVDVNTVGPYTVTYNVVDSSTNAAVQVTRTVNVTSDITKPVITLIGAATVSFERGLVYFENGATATDNVDGNITANIITVNPVDGDVAGTYTVTFDVDDIAGNSAIQVTRTVNVVDTVAPGVSIVNQPASVSNLNAFTVTFQFTEIVNGFDSSDITFTNSTLSNFINVGGVGDTYRADIKPNGVGDVSVAVNANVAQDPSANSNTAAITQVTTFDNTPPDVVVTSSPTVNLANQSAYTVSGTCTAGDGDVLVLLSLGPAFFTPFETCTVGGTWSSTFDLSSLSDTSAGFKISVGGRQTDAAGNIGSAVAVDVDKDTVKPSVQIQNVPAFVNTNEFFISIVFDEDVTGFDSGDIAVTNGAVNAASFNVVDAKTYTVGVIANGVGDVTLNVAANIAQDLAANDNNAATPVVAVFDIIAPVVTITTAPVVNAVNVALYTVAGNCNNGDGDVTVGIPGATPTSRGVPCNAGSWTADFDVTLIGDGVNVITINASQTDVATNKGVAPSVQVDKDILISVPTVSMLLTNNIAPVISGMADADSSNVIAVGGATYNVIATVGDVWSLNTALATPTSGMFALLNGSNEVVVTSTDAANNIAVDVSTNEITLTLDDDGDGIPNIVECPSGAFDNTCPDSDGDLIPDFQEVDSDNDGIPDLIEVGLDVNNPLDSDGDGMPDYQDTDSDDDNIDDAIEAGIDPTMPIDNDGDGIPDYVDVGNTGDSDGDGIPDTLECPAYPGCTDTDGDGTPDYLDTDADNDGIDDAFEAGIDPTMPIDTDGDGTPDYQDTDSDGDGTDDDVERQFDNDGDGIPDYVDAASAGPLPNAGDSDGDGISDKIECQLYPLCADSDSDGMPDYMEIDSDGDGILDVNEAGSALNDADNDGIDDAFDIDVTGLINGIDQSGGGVDGTQPDGIDDTRPLDTDGDGTPDYQDTDSDGDGIDDIVECPAGTPCPDADNDGIADQLDASDGDASGTDVAGSGDSDGDGISDFDECVAGIPCSDIDQDGLPDYMDSNPDDGPAADPDNDARLNYLDPDDDNDGIPDTVEDPGLDADNNPATNPLDSDLDGTPDYLDTDSDNDGLSDAVESGASGNDSDGDNIDDTYDIDLTLGTDSDLDGIDDNVTPLDSDGDSLPDYLDTVFDGNRGAVDTDGDGLSDETECPVFPTNCPDSDGDGTPDYLETDSDNDGIGDSDETGELASGILVDTDGDGTPDYQDTDSDNDGAADSAEGAADIDNDGIPDYVDADTSGSPFGGDSDGDGVEDLAECNSYPNCADSDNDGTPDYMDADSKPYDPNANINTGVNGVGSNGPWTLLLVPMMLLIRRKIKHTINK